jgi:hypothetical protein
MPVAIKNLTLRPVYVPLNSGTNLRLSPGEVAGAVADSELRNNSKIEKLRSRRAISVEPQADDAVREARVDKSAPAAAAEDGGDDGESRPKSRKKG